MKGVHNFLVTVAAILALALALAASIASAYDPSPLQDFCVATNETQNGLFVNGKFCKNPKLVTPEDFFSSGFNIPGNTNNRLGFSANVLNVDRIPGLNTQGLSVIRLDFAPFGQVPPHTHPRASEIIVVDQGTLYIGFVTSDEDGNRLFAKILRPGDVYVFPFGLIHFQFNPNPTPAVAFTALSSQYGGFITIADALFGSNPAINPVVLAKAFQLDTKTVKQLQQKFA